MNKLLGRLQTVDLRQVWINEAGDFTPWLAQEENLALLADTIGLELELEAVEKNVGPFRADIICKDTVSDSFVLIENQLERTDHSHLGQVLTYAAGLNAVTIVWIARHFTDEHRAALDWLNEVTNEDINFFGLEIELWRIGDSPVAPKFTIVSQPNAWTKTIASSRQGEFSETEKFYLDFWTGFNRYLEDRPSQLKPRKPRAADSYRFALGHSNFRLSAFIQTQKRRLGVSIMIRGEQAKPYFFALQAQQAQIEQALGSVLTWWELPDKKSSYISLYRNGINPSDRSQWSDYYAWLRDKIIAYHRVFSPLIRTLEISDLTHNEETP